jgi:hypothetical protein
MAGLTAYPNGLSSMGSPVQGGTYLTTGSVFFVDSNKGSNDYPGKNPEKPFATVDHAVTHCTSGKMDTIFVAPNHAETISSSTEMRISVDGICVIGLGRGENRPTFTLDTTASSKCDITGHSVYMENLLFVSGVDAITYGIHVGATEVELRNIEWRDDATNNYQVNCLIATSSSGAGGCIIDGLVYNCPEDPGGTKSLKVIHMRSPRRCEIKNCFIISDSCEVIYSTTGVVANAGGGNIIRNNFIMNTTGANIIVWSSDAKPSVICDNVVAMTCSGENAIVADTGSFLFRNFEANEEGNTGAEMGAASAT